MGRDDIDDKKNPTWGDQYPAHDENVASFLMDKYETTNAQYVEFVKAMHHKPPSYWGNKENPPAGKENFPVTNVSLADAKAYADWITKREKRICRLPTEKEWEYAARNGSQDTSFPWGSDWRPGISILDGAPVAVGTVAVGTSGDLTLAGVSDMLGNVTEWTSDLYLLYRGHPSVQVRKEDFIVIRGLNFKAKSTPDQQPLFKRTEFMLTYRNQAKESDESLDYVGFRLVCTP